MIIILFGLPGTGKNFIAKIFRDDYNFYLLDADEVLPSAAFHAIKKNRMVSEMTRQAFYQKLATTAKRLEEKHGAIVIPRTFTYERWRHYFKKLLPESKFVLIEARREIRYRRISKRSHHIDLEYAKKFDDIFEKPQILHYTIKNNSHGITTLKHRIVRIIEDECEESQ